jgi:hypothetical protein
LHVDCRRNLSSEPSFLPQRFFWAVNLLFSDVGLASDFRRHVFQRKTAQSAWQIRSASDSHFIRTLCTHPSCKSVHSLEITADILECQGQR